MIYKKILGWILIILAILLAILSIRQCYGCTWFEFATIAPAIISIILLISGILLIKSKKGKK